jgi:DNA repair exonuclease SbcCD ATPase subunit
LHAKTSELARVQGDLTDAREAVERAERSQREAEADVGKAGDDWKYKVRALEKENLELMEEVERLREVGEDAAGDVDTVQATMAALEAEAAAAAEAAMMDVEEEEEEEEEEESGDSPVKSEGDAATFGEQSMHAVTAEEEAVPSARKSVAAAATPRSLAASASNLGGARLEELRSASKGRSFLANSTTGQAAPLGDDGSSEASDSPMAGLRASLASNASPGRRSRPSLAQGLVLDDLNSTAGADGPGDCQQQ